MPKTRGNGDGSYRVLPTGTHEGRQMVNGQRLTAYGRTRGEAQARLRAKVTKARAGVVVRDGNIKTGDYLTRWLDEHEVRGTTKRAYRIYATKHLIPAFAKIKLDELSVADVQRLMRAMAAGGSGATPCSPNTVRQARAILRKALNDAMAASLVSRNVAALASPPKAPRFTVQALPPDDARALLKALEGDRLEALYAVALALGLRQSEALGLTWDAINLGKRTITVRQTLKRIDRAWVIEPPKSERSRRTLPIPAALVPLIESHRRRMEAERPSWEDANAMDLVFVSLSGRPLHAATVTHHFQKVILPKAGLGHLRFHDLRHATASLLLARGISLRGIMEILGHSQIGITANTYAHLSDEMKRDAADAMDAVFAPVK